MKDDTSMFLGSFRGCEEHLWLFQEILKEFQSCFKGDSRGVQVIFKDVTWTFLRVIEDCSVFDRMFKKVTRCSKEVSFVF